MLVSLFSIDYIGLLLLSHSILELLFMPFEETFTCYHVVTKGIERYWNRMKGKTKASREHEKKKKNSSE